MKKKKIKKIEKKDLKKIKGGVRYQVEGEADMTVYPKEYTPTEKVDAIK